MTTLEKYLRNHQSVDHFIHVTELNDKKLVFTISPSGLAGDPVEITLHPEKEAEK